MGCQLHNNGAESVQLLIKKFSLFGIEGQIWMLLVVFLIAVFVIIAWKTRDRN